MTKKKFLSLKSSLLIFCLLFCVEGSLFAASRIRIFRKTQALFKRSFPLKNSSFKHPFPRTSLITNPNRGRQLATSTSEFFAKKHFSPSFSLPDFKDFFYRQKTEEANEEECDLEELIFEISMRTDIPSTYFSQRLKKSFFFQKVWFSHLEKIRKELEELEDNLDKGLISKRKIKRSKGSAMQLRQKLKALEERESSILSKAISFYQSLRRENQKIDFNLNPWPFSKDKENLKQRKAQWGKRLDELSPVLREAFLLKKISNEKKLLNILRINLEEPKQESLDKNFFQTKIEISEIKNKVSKQFPHLVSYFFQIFNITTIPENFPKLRKTISQETFLESMINLYIKATTNYEASVLVKKFPTYLDHFLDKKEKLNEQELNGHLLLIHKLSYYYNFEEILSVQFSALQKLAEKTTLKLGLDIKEVKLVYQFIEQKLQIDPSRLYGYLTHIDAQKPSDVRRMRRVFIKMIRGKKIPPLNLKSSEHIEAIFEGKKELLPLWRNDYELPVSDFFKNPKHLKELKGSRFLISSNPEHFFLCSSGFFSCLDTRGEYGNIIASIMSDPHHKLLIFFSEDGTMIARGFLRLAILESEINGEDQSALLLEKFYGRNGGVTPRLEKAMKLFALRYSEEMGFPLFEVASCKETKLKGYTINLGSAAPNCPGRYYDSSYEGFESKAVGHIKAQVKRISRIER